MRILVTGGTGTLGRDVVEILRRRGHSVRVLTRRTGGGDGVVRGDLATGDGLAQAVEGIDTIINAASATADPQQGQATDVDGTRRLLDAARAAGVRHFLHVSIVGIERVRAVPYYRHKLGAEAVVRDGGVPWSILRATQFHSLIERFLWMFSRSPGLLLVPVGWRFQPIDSSEVAERLADVAEVEPAGMLPDMGGPEVRGFGSLGRAWLRARGKHRLRLPIPLPGASSRQIAAGGLICPDRRDGKITWEQWLEPKYGRAAG